MSSMVLPDLPALPAFPSLPARAGRRDTVLVIDDQHINIETVYRTLGAEYEIIMATDGQRGIDACRQQLPSLVLLDLVMPGLSGIDVAACLKSDPRTRAIPIIFVTASSDSDAESACWEAGAVDFVNKPFNPVTLRRRVQVHLALKLQAEQLHHMAYIDGLTNIPNRRYFNDRISVEIGRARRAALPLTLVLADIDYFKSYNDCEGHQAGDACLVQVAAALQGACRRHTDFVARYGGEEFAAILPGIGLDEAPQVAAALQHCMHALALPHPASAAAAIITISAGIVCVGARDWAGQSSAETLLRQADAQLYLAKQSGRDRACIAAAGAPARP